MPATLLAAGVVASTAFASELPETIAWKEAESAGALLGGNVHGDELRVENTTGKPTTIPILKIDRPAIGESSWVLHGSVRGDGIVGNGYLETWSRFGAAEEYFSRTLATDGPMAHLTGTFAARPFALPFVSRAGKAPPTAIELNVFLPADGVVYLGPVTLSEPAGAAAIGAPRGWLSPRGAGIFGGVAGTGLGLFGALVGTLAALGRARRLVLASVGFGLALGIACLAGGLAAFLLGQPAYVAATLLLSGAIATSALGAAWFVVRRRYQQAELRAMRALDA